MLRRVALVACGLALLGCTLALASSQYIDGALLADAAAAPERFQAAGANATHVAGGDSAFEAPAFAASPGGQGAGRRARILADIRAENAWKNDLVLWVLPPGWRERMPTLVQSWARNWVLCMGLYFAVGAAWAYYTYYCFGDRLYPPGHIPGAGDMLEQMKVAMVAMPVYAMLPAATEYAVEQGWTVAYARVSDVGLPRFVAYFAAYMACVEFFVYWQHRLLHDVRVGYRLLHYIHHKYNKEHTLSPFAGLAFHPLDGILQALPYSWTLLFVPMHFLTHELLLFATAVWTTNIHDCLHGKVDPIMGAGYHTIHHTTYRHNYGHYFTYMDRLFGTLITPEQFDQQQGASSKTD
jgi:lathosterol oxidase